MLDWIKKITKEYPFFWKLYLEKFDKKSNRFVIICTETSGLSSKLDVILSIGAVSVENNQVLVSDSFEILIEREFDDEEAALRDLYENNGKVKFSENEAIEKFISFIGNSILVGHRIDFDVEIINEALEKLNCGRLKNDAIDVEVMYKKLINNVDKSFSVNDLKNIYKLPINERIESGNEAFSIAVLFLKLKAKLGLN